MTWLDTSTEDIDSVQSQGSNSWHNFRSKHLGASEAPILLNESDFTTIKELWELKTGKRKPFSGNFATQRGTAAEPTIRAMYEEKFGCKLTTPTLVWKEWDVLSASLDGITPAGRPVEMKYPSAAKHEMAKNGEVPHTYRAQLQQQMLVAGASSCDYVSYDGTSIVVVDYMADKEYQDRIVKAARKFWACVESNTPPEAPKLFTDISAISAFKKWKELHKKAAMVADELERARKECLSFVDSKDFTCEGVQVTVQTRAGSVDTDAICKKYVIDKELFRKPATEFHKFELIL